MSLSFRGCEILAHLHTPNISHGRNWDEQNRNMQSAAAVQWIPWEVLGHNDLAQHVVETHAQSTIDVPHDPSH
jgi:hypothetical protein